MQEGGVHLDGVLVNASKGPSPDDFAVGVVVVNAPQEAGYVLVVLDEVGHLAHGPVDPPLLRRNLAHAGERHTDVDRGNKRPNSTQAIHEYLRQCAGSVANGGKPAGDRLHPTDLLGAP